ncbi:CheR family methyltransferase [Capillimicrobium parvum]|uniref:CheR-type methyltransferase domain-containing protein n=1 Tax=Capillimicrobium parvum TaxID=2884022 RepID=A0A9E6XV45_9ACTN|nr:CheR family methyltransferase [Capillimicrobium parvum]UGS34976.1 hypothetical protein DSM104329_01360 [Capillimicrobium parvum]
MRTALEELAERIRAASGLVLEGSRLGSLESALVRLALGTPEEVLRAADDPLEGAALTLRLVDEVAVKETFFFRHDDELRALDWAGLLAAARARGDERLRVWCTACATGEEAYSLALLALEALGPRAPLDVLGTDIAQSALDRACEGTYRPRAVASVPAAMRERWFEPAGAGLRVGTALRGVVRFATHNLVHDDLPPSGEARFDVITCRNVLIYFSPGQVQRTIVGLDGALVPGGRLVIGAADRLSTGTVGRLALPQAACARPASRAQRPRRRPVRRVRDRPGGAPQSSPPDSRDCLERGRQARARGDHTEAVRWLRRALYLDPEFGIAGLELALAYSARGDVPAARRALWTAIHATQPPQTDDDAELLAECRARLARLGGGQEDGGT